MDQGGRYHSAVWIAGRVENRGQGKGAEWRWGTSTRKGVCRRLSARWGCRAGSLLEVLKGGRDGGKHLCYHQVSANGVDLTWDDQNSGRVGELWVSRHIWRG